MLTRTRKRWTRKLFALHLIEESDLAYFLHTIFQNQHMAPGVVMGLRTENDKIPDGERAFMLASTRKALTEGDTPVKIRNFASKNKKEAAANG